MGKQAAKQGIGTYHYTFNAQTSIIEMRITMKCYWKWAERANREKQWKKTKNLKMKVHLHLRFHHNVIPKIQTQIMSRYSEELNASSLTASDGERYLQNGNELDSNNK